MFVQCLSVFRFIKPVFSTSFLVSRLVLHFVSPVRDSCRSRLDMFSKTGNIVVSRRILYVNRIVLSCMRPVRRTDNQNHLQSHSVAVSLAELLLFAEDDSRFPVSGTFAVRSIAHSHFPCFSVQVVSVREPVAPDMNQILLKDRFLAGFPNALARSLAFTFDSAKPSVSFYLSMRKMPKIEFIH